MTPAIRMIRIDQIVAHLGHRLMGLANLRGNFIKYLSEGIRKEPRGSIGALFVFQPSSAWAETLLATLSGLPPGLSARLPTLNSAPRASGHLTNALTDALNDVGGLLQRRSRYGSDSVHSRLQRLGCHNSPGWPSPTLPALRKCISREGQNTQHSKGQHQLSHSISPN